jgi:hypothetical protein
MEQSFCLRLKKKKKSIVSDTHQKPPNHIHSTTDLPRLYADLTMHPTTGLINKYSSTKGDRTQDQNSFCKCVVSLGRSHGDPLNKPIPARDCPRWFCHRALFQELCAPGLQNKCIPRLLPNSVPAITISEDTGLQQTEDMLITVH